jgi:hypothetical protein
MERPRLQRKPRQFEREKGAEGNICYGDVIQTVPTISSPFSIVNVLANSRWPLKHSNGGLFFWG